MKTIKKIVILALVATAMLSLTATSEAAVILALGARRQRVVRVQRVVQVQEVVQQVVFTPLAVFQPIQAVSFVPLVQTQVVAPIYGQYQAPAAIRAPERIIEKVDATGRVIERIIER